MYTSLEVKDVFPVDTTSVYDISMDHITLYYKD